MPPSHCTHLLNIVFISENIVPTLHERDPAIVHSIGEHTIGVEVTLSAAHLRHNVLRSKIVQGWVSAQLTRFVPLLEIKRVWSMREREREREKREGGREILYFSDQCLMSSSPDYWSDTVRRRQSSFPSVSSDQLYCSALHTLGSGYRAAS